MSFYEDDIHPAIQVVPPPPERDADFWWIPIIIIEIIIKITKLEQLHRRFHK